MVVRSEGPESAVTLRSETLSPKLAAGGVSGSDEYGFLTWKFPLLLQKDCRERGRCTRLRRKSVSVFTPLIPPRP